MGAVHGKITSLGNYVTIDTAIIRTDAYGREYSGLGDTQKERFIDGLTIGNRRFGPLSCPSNLYPFFEVDKDVILYTWQHPFLGWPPIRTGIIGVAYPGEKRAYVMSMSQVLMGLVVLALMPLIWLIPAIFIAGFISLVLRTPDGVTAFLTALIALSPWIAAGIMLFNYVRMKGAHPYATTPV
ncbi:MAG: hypothetical protein KDA53_14450 [Hyphomonas sp.]|nr:hypothetical protein [Hyphomonas sp.]